MNDQDQAAEQEYRQTVRADPANVEAQNALAVVLARQQRFDEAEVEFARALTLSPDAPDILYNLGLMRGRAKRFADAETTLRRVVELRPDHAFALNELGTVLEALRRFDEAEGVYRAALGIRPDFTKACNNLGRLYSTLQRDAEAEAATRGALSIESGNAIARWNLGMILLAQGRYREGWALYEARRDPALAHRLDAPPQLPYALWQGESLRGRSVSVWPEQGFGDQIQFVRYLPLLRVAGARRITLVCSRELQRLFENNGLADEVVTKEDAADLPEQDFWTPLMSIPLRLGTTLDTLPAQLPYLDAPARNPLNAASDDAFRVGLVWRGSAGQANDGNRSLPSLRTLAPLWKVPGIHFVSLQMGPVGDEAASPPPDQPISDARAVMADFADTAALIRGLDLVISVDTAVAHLAGALGKPCWVLLPFLANYWCWLRDRDDSPWYPQVMRLFRQSVAGDWREVVQRLTAALASEVGARR
ncbi:MAG: tetratricopeptide repeat protein [Gammaproteobacteria bacterium]|nr:tetratricopeptide repeat protein [Gammaproteobacteria bacterium]MCP5137560.1 tetratricopeptide repeat protein [Gammaproteobacteria bacterium]